MVLSYDQFFIQTCIRDVWEVDSDSVGLQTYNQAYSDKIYMSINGQIRSKEDHANAAKEIRRDFKIMIKEADIILKKAASDDELSGTVAFRLAVTTEEKATGKPKYGNDVIVATVDVVDGKQTLTEYVELTV